jgi:hypothetical protein
VVYLEARAASARMLKMYGPESRKGACNHQESSTSERLPRYPEDALINEREAFWPWQRVLAWWSTFLLDAPALREAGGVRLRSLNTTSLTSCFCKASVWSALASKVHSLSISTSFRRCARALLPLLTPCCLWRRSRRHPRLAERGEC